MQIQNNSRVAFTGFDNIYAGQHKDGNSSTSVISMRLNNEGVNDLDRFQPLLKETSKENILTISFENIAKGEIPEFPNGASQISINGFPLMIEEADVRGVSPKVLKDVEKISIPFAQNTVDLLKRVAKATSVMRDSSLATFTAMSDARDAASGLYGVIPGFKQKVTELFYFNNLRKGEVKVFQEVAQNITAAISDKMIKYFK